jgi:hypothetical protein
MKRFLLFLLFSLPAISFADTTITGMVTSNGEGRYTVQESTSGQIYAVDIHFQGGSVCGTAIQFGREMRQADGHQTQLTGIFATLSSGEPVFEADVDGIKVLP